MRNRNLAFLDLETTGFDPERHEIIEIGCVLARQVPLAGRGPKPEAIGELELKVKPENLAAADPEALRINGYNDADWLFASALAPALTALNEKAADAVIVGQNVSFDWSFLQKGFFRCGLSPRFHYHRLDLMSMAVAKLYHQTALERFSLAALADYFGVKNERAHRALSDARTTFEIYRRLIEV